MSIKRYVNNDDEFFYDDSFDDYHNTYIMRFFMELITSEMVNVPDEVYIYCEMPEEDFKLKDVIGIFYPVVNNRGICGSFKIFNPVYEKLSEYCKLKPYGSYITEFGTFVKYELEAVYIEFKPKI